MTEDAGEATYDIVETLTAVVERKTNEILQLEKALKRYKNADRIAQTKNLIAYLAADVASYRTVLADVTGDESYLEGLDLDSSDEVECPCNYAKYLEGLSEEEFAIENVADTLRTEHCEEVLDSMYREIGETALNSKKMIRFLLDDPYSVSVVGELIYNDDYLYDAFRAMVQAKKDKKSKKKRKTEE